MKLSADTFRDLASAYSNSTTEHERRRSQRVEVQTRVPLSLIRKGEKLTPVPIMVRDVSPRGINILYPEQLPAGQQFTVQLTGTAKTVTLLCTVLHSRQVSNGLHSVGAEFTCVLPASDSRPASDDGTQKRIRDSVLE